MPRKVLVTGGQGLSPYTNNHSTPAEAASIRAAAMIDTSRAGAAKRST
jgi:hypothetical protein